MVSGHVVTVEVFVSSDQESDATDGIGEMLRTSHAIDWRFTKVVPIGLSDMQANSEGKVFEILDTYARPLSTKGR